MNTTTTPRPASQSRPWWHLRLLSGIACLAMAVSAQAAPVVIDHFDEPAAGIVEFFVGNNVGDTWDDSEMTGSVWGGRRDMTLTRTSVPAEQTVLQVNSVFEVSKLSYAEADVQTSTLELQYGGGVVASMDSEVLLDVDYTDTDYSIQLTVSAFNPGDDPFTDSPLAIAQQSLNVMADGTNTGTDSYDLGFDLSHPDFINVHGYFGATSNIAFTLLLTGSGDADITLESILLQALDGGPDVVPEPSTWALGSMSVLGLAYAGYRRRRNRKCKS